MNQEKIKKQAKEILDKFSKALEKVKVSESKVERPEDRRQEYTEPSKEDSEFREILFNNAKEVRDECIIGEKGEWTK